MTYLFYDYIQFLSTCYSETTKDVYIININLYLNFLKEYKGKNDMLTICNVTKADIYNYIAYMQNLSKGTISCRINSIRQFYLFLNRDLGEFLFQDIKLFNTTSKLPKYLFSSQIKAILNYYQNKRNKLIIFLFLNTGIRISELANIYIENINLKEKYFSVKVKGGYYRNVFISKEVADKLKEYIGTRTSGNLFNIKRRAIHNIVKKPMIELGIEGSAHTLRHTFATEMYKQTKDILVVKELLGHKSISSTEIYTHLESDMLKQAINSNPLANYEVGGKKWE